MTLSRTVRRWTQRRSRLNKARFRQLTAEWLEPRLPLACSTVVVNTSDSGIGSLRDAIECANSTPGTDTISFNVPGSGVQTIIVTSALPAITAPVNIDGYTQPGAIPNTNAIDDPNPTKRGFNGTLLIELSGNGSVLEGLTVSAAGSTIRGLAINRFSHNGVNLGSGSVVEGCFIGTDASGALDRGNSGAGIVVSGSSNRIGGTSPASRNVISNNLYWGVSIQGTGGATTGNVVQGNFVGTDASGSKPLGNRQIGVRLYQASNNTVGGLEPGARNIVSANGFLSNGSGIYVENANSNTVQGNYVGTDVTGTQPLGNASFGIVLYVSGNNLIGGTDVAARNVIADSKLGGGVGLSSASQNTLQGNYIGTDASGTLPLGNTGDGVGLFQGSSSNIIGGTSAGAANVIGFNRASGVHLVSDSGSGNAIVANSIFSNSALGIELGGTSGGVGDGVTPNDVGDADSGPNKLQNFPVISSVTLSGPSLSVQYAVPSTTANSAYPLRVEFFKADSDGQEGKTFLGFDTYAAAEASTTKTFSFTPAILIAAGDKIIATATDNNGNTSEFSASTTVASDVAGASIAGTKWNDKNGNGIRDAGEPGLVGATITLDAGADGTIDKTTVTDSGGAYSFTDLSVGTYAVGEIVSSEWGQTYPAYPLGGENFPIGDFKPVYSQGGTIRVVPGQYASIQAAINEAVDGDTIQVGPGIYQENISFLGKAIVITSLTGPDSTIIDGNQAGSVVMYSAKAGSRLHGFTLQNGRANDDGGGIYVSGPGIITSNRIIDNQTCGDGGGIYAIGSPLIQGNEIRRNSQRSNCSGGEGSGLYVAGGSAQIINNLIADNKAPRDAIEVNVASPLIRGNIIRGNVDSGIELTNNVSGTIIVQNLITGNTGPGIDAFYSPAVIGSNTIDNNGGSEGTAIWGLSPDFAKVFNNIFAAAPGKQAVSCSRPFPGSAGEFKNNLVFSPVTNSDFCSQAGADGNIAADPLFVDSASGDFHLRGESPAIDAGLNSATALPSVDMDGHTRILDGNNDGTALVDMGVDEFGGSQVHVVNLSIGETRKGLDFGNQDLSQAPVITSNGGNASASVSVNENTTAVADVDATSTVAGQILTYSIVGGADAGKFVINSSSGELTFVSAPDFENPTDAGGNNVYDVVVQVSDGNLSDTQTIAVKVTNVNDQPPVITSNGGGATASISVPENTTAVTDVNATDADGLGSLVYSKAGGADAARFSINSTSGVLRFIVAPNFESPTDIGADNVYEVIVRVSDGSLSDTQTIAVTITNVSEPPTITSDGGGVTASISVPENTHIATDVNANGDSGPLVYGISGGADGPKFSINPTTGLLNFLAAPNFESPGDAGGDNVYDVVVQVTDGEVTDTQTLAIRVTNVNDLPTAGADEFSTFEDAPLTIDPIKGVLANDTDEDVGDSKTVVAVAGGGVLWDEATGGDLPAAQPYPVLLLAPGVNEIRGTTGDSPSAPGDLDAFIVQVPEGLQLTSFQYSVARAEGAIRQVNWSVPPWEASGPLCHWLTSPHLARSFRSDPANIPSGKWSSSRMAAEILRISPITRSGSTSLANHSWEGNSHFPRAPCWQCSRMAASCTTPMGDSNRCRLDRRRSIRSPTPWPIVKER